MKQRRHVSEKKLRANRENAQKSTGPRTERGKAYSRGNATKHGIFARHFSLFYLQNESWSEYEDLLEDLRAHHQPVGRAEELEVERIAQGWWRLGRANRYENAANQILIRDIAIKELERGHRQCDDLDKEDNDFFQQLQELSKEMEAGNDAGENLRERLVGLKPEIGFLWPQIEEIAQFVLKDSNLCNREKDPSQFLGLAIIAVAKGFVERMSTFRRMNVTNLAFDQHAIPERDTLDKIIRYETSIERSLARAMDRLESLQRARKEREKENRDLSLKMRRTSRRIRDERGHFGRD